jgi:hypothetical protein
MRFDAVLRHAVVRCLHVVCCMGCAVRRSYVVRVAMDAIDPNSLLQPNIPTLPRARCLPLLCVHSQGTPANTHTHTHTHSSARAYPPTHARRHPHAHLGASDEGGRPEARLGSFRGRSPARGVSPELTPTVARGRAEQHSRRSTRFVFPRPAHSGCGPPRSRSILCELLGPTVPLGPMQTPVPSARAARLPSDLASASHRRSPGG